MFFNKKYYNLILFTIILGLVCILSNKPISNIFKKIFKKLKLSYKNFTCPKEISNETKNVTTKEDSKKFQKIIPKIILIIIQKIYKVQKQMIYINFYKL